MQSLYSSDAPAGTALALWLEDTCQTAMHIKFCQISYTALKKET